MLNFTFIMYIFFSINLYGNELFREINDHNIPFKGNLPQETYHKYCKNIYSQNGEDGILEKLLDELDIKIGSFCEFGAADGIQSSNTYNLIKQGWRGVAIEADLFRYKKLKYNYKCFPKVKVFCGYVLHDNINSNLNFWLKKGNLPVDFDILSIDIDCDDYYVWENLEGFNPKIVIFETNSYRDPVFDELPRQPSEEYNIDPLKIWKPDRVALGCSFISAIKLGLSKGYIPLSYTGNIIFLRRDLVCYLKEFPYKDSNNPYDYLDLYSYLAFWGNKWFTNSGLIFNVAVKDFYFLTKSKFIETSFLNSRMKEIKMLNELKIGAESTKIDF